MREDIPILKVAGFPVSLHWSVLVILWLFAWSLAGFLSDRVRGYPGWAYWLAGICGAVVFLASLLAHELSHSIIARRAGIDVSGVTLWLLGGVSRLRGEAKTPGMDFRIAIAGPATSVLFAVIFGGVAAVFAAVGFSPLVVAVAMWLAWVNLVLALFNLLPGAPLDGGRILRAYLWHKHKDPQRAAVGAARAGRVLAMVLIGAGLVAFVWGAYVTGIWFAFLGWFLLTAARAEENQIISVRALAGVRVADAMSPHPRRAPASITLDEFVHRYLLGDRHSAYPVEEPDGSVTGLITLAQVRQVPPERRGSTLVRDVAIPLDHVVTAAPAEPLTVLLERLEPDPGARALVVDGGQVVGIVTANDIARLLNIRRAVAS